MGEWRGFLCTGISFWTTPKSICADTVSLVLSCAKGNRTVNASIDQDDQPDSSAEAWSRLRGALKDVFAELGGGEAYLQAERKSFLQADGSCPESSSSGCSIRKYSKHES